ncbi:choice-of-anchor J domain-containing protein, partial [bacterium]|nr:choice-of-anchor J domain-containing protein [bacterium]
MRVILTGIVLLCLMSFVPLSMDCSAQEYEQDWYFDQEGFKSNQNTQFGIGEESINLFNGNLILSYVDLRIPGNDGNDLVLQRVYNSKVRKWSGSASILNGASWVGLGWTLHPGRLYNSTAIIPLAKPVLEMPDGSRHRFYPDIEQHSDSSFIYRSKENWGLRWISHLHVQIFFSDGTIWDFNDNPYTDGVPDEEGNYFARLRYIMNPSWCNPIYFYYDQTVKRNLARIQIGGDPEDEVGINPEVIFNTNESDHDILESIQYRDANGNVVYIYYEVAQIIYDEENDGVTKLLYSVTPPVGPPVIYSYDEDPQGWPCELINVNNPFGGNIHYEYAVQNIPISDGPALCPIDYIRTNTVISKTYSGSDIVTGTWTYTYDTGGCYVQVLDPAGNISRHFFKGLCDESDLGRWEIGLNYKNEFYEGLTTLLKTEEMTWYGHLFGNDIDDDCHHDPPISQCKWVSDCHAAECLARQPRLSEQKITLNSDYYSTFYNSYDLYGNVTEMVETLFNSTEPYRKTVTSYVWKQDEIFAHEFISGHITGLPLDQKIQKGSGSTVYHVKNQYYQGARWTEEEPYICKFGKLMAKTIDPDNLALHTYYEYEELDTTIPPYFDNHDGNLIRINDPNDHDTYYAWENSTLKSITTPAGWDRFDRSINYDTGLVETQTDPNGNITSFGYDPLGRLTEINYPIDASVNISYNIDPGDPLDPNDDYFDNVTTTRGGLTDSEIVEYFDDLGRVKKIRKKLGGFSGYSYIHYVYDSVGNKTFESEPTFFDSDLCSTPTCPGTYYQYDALGRVTQETTPDGTTTYVYDGEDTIITYPNSTTKTITKDPFGNITQVIDEGGTTFHYEYDLLNNLTKIYKSSPTSWDAKFEYDSAGRLLQEQPRGGGTNKYELDDNGNITKMTALITDGSYYIQTFDVNNRLTSQTFDDGHTFQFEYDDDNISQCRNCLGKMNKQIFTSPGSGLSGQINYNRYDALGKLLEVTYEFPDPVGTHTIGYSYDHFGNCDEIDYPTAGFHQKFDYGCDNRISSISQRVDSVEYNAAGGMSTIQFSNGVFTEIPTDENLRNRPDYIQTRKGYSGNTLMKLDYSYDNMGNIWELERSSSYGPNPVSPDVFTYDNFNRLTRVDYGVPSGQADPEYFAYTYDTRGNQLTRTSSAILESDHPSWSLEYNYYDTITTPGFVYEKYYNLIESPLLNGQTRYIDFGYFNRITDVSLDTNAYDLWESFDGFLGAFPPAGWTVYPDSYYWKIDSSTAHSECCSIKNNWNHENRWLITPLVNLDYFADPFLIYWEAATAGTSPTNRRTLISTDYAGSGDPAQANWTLLREITDNVTSSWSEIAIPLAAYAQESVYVAFQYDQETGTGVFWNIDDVFIGESSGPERISVSMTYDGDGRRIRKTVTHKVEPVQEEGFDGDFPPTGWLTYQVEGDPWDSSSYYVHSGSYSALHTYFESDQDSWLISPAIDLTGLRDPRLNYWELVEYGNYAEQHNVLISTDYAGSGDPSTATWDLIN